VLAVLRCASTDIEKKTDVTKRFIDSAIDEGFQIIDVNIPTLVDEDTVGCFPSDGNEWSV
jgi:hypothetical protein